MGAIDLSRQLTRYWTGGDGVAHAITMLLLLMSLASWYLILAKSWSAWRLRRITGALDAFWSAPGLTDAIAMLRLADPDNIYTPLAARGADAATQTPPAGSLDAGSDRADRITRALRQQIQRASARLESGLTLLASIGATAPFVGLLGTVWGLYHALTAISGTEAVRIDRIAGPVGEALVMTALGLTVAIPAVLAYNAFTRVNRLTLAGLDAFAHDLQAFLTTGARKETP